jgi:tetratricopeptide (TPR) repeat protein
MLVLPAVPLLQAQEKTTGEVPASPKRLRVAVLGLENRTGDPALAHWQGAATLWSKSLQEVKALQVRSGGAVRYALWQVGLRAGDPIDPDHARVMGGHIEAQRVIWGHYAQEAGQWYVAVRVMNVATGAVSPALCAKANDWFDVRDRLNEQILAEFRITPLAEEGKEMAERWTRSAEALDWYFRKKLAEEQEKPVSEWETHCRKALAADPNCTPVYAHLAATLATQGKFDVAEEAAEKALRLQPDCSHALFVLGWLAIVQRQTARAEAQFRRACQLEAEDADYLAYFAATLLAQGKADMAGPLLEKAVSLDRTNHFAHACLASVYAIRKQREEASRELEEMRRYLPPGFRGGNTLSTAAGVYEMLGQRPEAIEYHERALALLHQGGVNPDAIRLTERQIRRLKDTLTPAFLQIPMPKCYTEEAIDAILRDKLTERERSLVAHPFLCTDAMRQRAKDITRDADTGLDRARALFEELSARLDTPGRLQSRVAQAVFDAWENPRIRLVCMDQAVLFVALARAVDVDAFFVHVTKLPDGTIRNHACAAVFLEDRVLLVDPAQHWLGAPHQQYAILDDLQATAFLCFNNREGDAMALAAYRAGLKLWPDSRQGRVCLAGALYRAGQAPEARRVFAEISQPKSVDWEASIYWSLAGEAGAAEEHWEQAQECLLKSISICPTQSAAHFNLGRIYLSQGRLAEARTAFRTCLRHEPSDLMAGLARAAIAQINEQIDVDSASGASVPTPGPGG